MRFTYNDPELTRRVAEILAETLGQENVVEGRRERGAEDFGAYLRAGVPGVIFSFGAVEPKRYEEATKTGKPLPSLHSSEFAPDPVPTIRTGVASMTTVALNLLAPKERENNQVAVGNFQRREPARPRYDK